MIGRIGYLDSVDQNRFVDRGDWGDQGLNQWIRSLSLMV